MTHADLCLDCTARTAQHASNHTRTNFSVGIGKEASSLRSFTPPTDATPPVHTFYEHLYHFQVGRRTIRTSPSCAHTMNSHQCTTVGADDKQGRLHYYTSSSRNVFQLSALLWRDSTAHCNFPITALHTKYARNTSWAQHWSSYAIALHVLVKVGAHSALLVKHRRRRLRGLPFHRRLTHNDASYLLHLTFHVANFCHRLPYHRAQLFHHTHASHHAHPLKHSWRNHFTSQRFTSLRSLLEVMRQK